MQKSTITFFKGLFDRLSNTHRGNAKLFEDLEELKSVCAKPLGEVLQSYKQIYRVVRRGSDGRKRKRVKRKNERRALKGLYVLMHHAFSDDAQKMLPAVVQMLKEDGTRSVGLHTRIFDCLFQRLSQERRDAIRDYILEALQIKEDQCITEDGSRSSAWVMPGTAWALFGALASNRRITSTLSTDVDTRYIKFKHILPEPSENALIMIFTMMSKSDHVCAINAQSLGPGFTRNVLMTLGKTLQRCHNIFALNLGEYEFPDDVWEEFIEEYLCESNVGFIYLSEHLFLDKARMKRLFRITLRKNRKDMEKPKPWKDVVEYGETIKDITHLWFTPRQTKLYREAIEAQNYESALQILEDVADRGNALEASSISTEEPEVDSEAV